MNQECQIVCAFLLGMYKKRECITECVSEAAVLSNLETNQWKALLKNLLCVCFYLFVLS